MLWPLQKYMPGPISEYFTPKGKDKKVSETEKLKYSDEDMVNIMRALTQVAPES